jgi:hypothetical protein
MKIAKQLKMHLGDAEGSAEFKNGNVVLGTVAKKAPKSLPLKKIGAGLKKIGSGIKGRVDKVKGKFEKHTSGPHSHRFLLGSHHPSFSGPHSHHPHSHPNTTGAPLFDFQHVKPGTDAVGIQKKSYKPHKHGSLIVKFCNNNPAVTVVLSVKQIKHADGSSGMGKPSLSHHLKSFGHHKSHPSHQKKLISGLRHNNFFVVLNGAVVYPSATEQSKHSKSSHGFGPHVSAGQRPKQHGPAKARKAPHP